MEDTRRAMEEALEYYEKEAEKAVKYLEELLVSEAHIAEKVFRLSYLLGDVVEYEGASTLAKKMFREDETVDKHYRTSGYLHNRAFELRDKFCDKLRKAVNTVLKSLVSAEDEEHG